MAAMSPWMWVVGFGALVVLAVLAPNPIFVLILVLLAFEIIPPLAAVPPRRKSAPTTACRRWTGR